MMSGSDCGNVFMWHKATSSIVKWYRGDTTGVVNCLENHPHFPFVATSGLDNDIKIWAPMNESHVCNFFCEHMMPTPPALILGLVVLIVVIFYCSNSQEPVQHELEHCVNRNIHARPNSFVRSYMRSVARLLQSNYESDNRSNTSDSDMDEEDMVREGPPSDTDDDDDPQFHEPCEVQ